MLIVSQMTKENEFEKCLKIILKDILEILKQLIVNFFLFIKSTFVLMFM